MSVEDTRKRLLDTTRKLLISKGLQNTSMSLISKTSRVSVGSIYNLYESKEELINDAYMDSRQRMMDAALHIPVDALDTPKSYYKKMARSYLDAAFQYPDDFLFLSQYHLSPVIDKNILNSPDVPIGLPEHTVSYYVQKGILKPLEPRALDYIALGIVNQIINAHYSGFLTLTEDMIDTLLEACWDAISVHKTSADNV